MEVSNGSDWEAMKISRGRRSKSRGERSGRKRERKNERRNGG